MSREYVSERVVWEAMRSGAGVDSLVVTLPDEFHDWIYEVADRLHDEWLRMDRMAESAFNALEDADLIEDREAFALAIKDEPGWLKAALFAYREGADVIVHGRVRQTIWQNIEPKEDK
jgi:hypothetical protein